MITVVGSLNMDLVVQTEQIPRVGETVLARDLRYVEGGKGANQAVAAARLGGNVSMIGAVGSDDMGDRLLTVLERDGVDISGIKRSTEPNGIALIIVDANGNNSITVVSGANFDLDAEYIHLHEDKIAGASIVLAQLECPLEFVAEAMLVAKNHGCTTVLNPAPAQKLSAELLANVDILTPNETELELLSGHSTATPEEIEAAGRKLMESGIKSLIVTLGSKGCFYMDADSAEYYPSYKVKMTDSTAAGDCFNGALVTALDRGDYMHDAIHYAMKAAAISVTREGAQPSLPTVKDMENFDVWYQERQEK
ncbi:MAG: ribokinase [Eubacteriales bacterium]|nr:ribokinase [Eubacteriales bacterium]MDD4324146.1 ribokinase [Eubacteriales bacterium]MDD4540962.1 ribokinase [Eubacteriales bacterium]